MSQDMATQEKKELAQKEEQTVPARYFVPLTDIYETETALTLVMEVPGVEKKDLNVNLQGEVLKVEGRIDFAKYDGLRPLYSEYNVGHYLRTFTLPDKIDHDGVSAELADGVLTLTLRKAKDATPRRIPIS
jgi:HSP20 family molecular chaperone IbpA